MKFNILNNEPIQFFNAQGVLVGTIQISGSGDMIIKPESGSSRDIILGDQTTVGDVEIGLPSAEANLKLMGGGLISANGNTLTIGDAAAGDQLIFGAPITASNVQTASFSVSASHLIGGGGGGSGIFEATGSIFATTNVLEVTGSITLINTASNSTSSNTLSIEGSGSVSGSGIFDVRGSAGQLFEVQDGLDGVLMSVNDISGIPILTVSSSGDVILAAGSTLQGTAATASYVAGVSAAFPFAGAAVITGSLDITGSGNDIFKVRSSSGSLFSVDDGLDGILMSVNDISGLPIFEVSSSGRIEAEEGEAVIRSQRPIVTVATNPFTASLNNAGQYFRVGGNITCSIFVTASAHCPIGAEFDIFQTSSAGNMLFETGSGVTLNSKNGNLNLAGQFSSATLKYIGLDEWDLMGDLT